MIPQDEYSMWYTVILWYLSQLGDTFKVFFQLTLKKKKTLMYAIASEKQSDAQVSHTPEQFRL